MSHCVRLFENEEVIQEISLAFSEPAWSLQYSECNHCAREEQCDYYFSIQLTKQSHSKGRANFQDFFLFIFLIFKFEFN